MYRIEYNKEPAPLKRAEALKSLSRDHHYGLLLCWKIRTGLKTIDHNRIKKYTDYFFREHLLPHFKQEEKNIFPLLGEESMLVQKALADHKRLEQLFNEDHDILQSLVHIETELEKHIRFEERILFKELQRVATNEQLEKLVQIPEVVRKENWNDRFWEKTN